MPDVPVGHPLFGSLIPCPACMEERLQRKRFEKLLALSGLGPDLREKTFENFVVVHKDGPGRPVSNRAAWQAAKEFAENPQGWLILTGPPGCGKTHLAAAIANHCLRKGKLLFFVTVPELLDHFRFSLRMEPGFEELFERVKTVPLLVLDDLGAQKATDWSWEKLYQIIVYRRHWKLPMVVTTNMDLASSSFPDPRIASRLLEENWARKVLINAPDFRRNPDWYEREGR